MNESSREGIPLVVVGLNHRVAPVHVRERLAFGPDHTPAALRELAGDRGVIKEAVLLSTCNRVEMYVSASEPAQAQLQVERFLSARAGLSPAQLQQAVSASYGEG